MFEEDDKFYFVSVSVTHSNKPETSKCVRNTLLLGLYLIEPADGGVEVIYSSRSAVVNRFANRY